MNVWGFGAEGYPPGRDVWEWRRVRRPRRADRTVRLPTAVLAAGARIFRRAGAGDILACLAEKRPFFPHRSDSMSGDGTREARSVQGAAPLPPVMAAMDRDVSEVSRAAAPARTHPVPPVFSPAADPTPLPPNWLIGDEIDAAPQATRFGTESAPPDEAADREDTAAVLLSLEPATSPTHATDRAMRDTVEEVALRLEHVAREIRARGPEALDPILAGEDRLEAVVAGVVAGYLARPGS
jgi:hypothetical protein